MNQDTIVAIATATGLGGIGVIRVSGDKSIDVAQAILGKIPKVRYAEYLPFKRQDGSIIDEGIALLFKNPNSFTGEDIIEFQCHGGTVVLDMLLKEILSLGYTRQALPGEFSQRAFLNGKIDLTQAEAIADLINATSVQAANSAMNSLQGQFSEKIHVLNQELIKLRTYVEATIDFPDESIDFIEDGKVVTGLTQLQQHIKEILIKAKQGVILQEGIRIVIAGRPNAGKSSLLNALCQRDCAIVTDIEGTTRDVLRENINIDGMPLHIIDTAGLRHHSSDIVEKIGIDRAWNEILTANRILFVYDVTKDDPSEQLQLFQDIKDKTQDSIKFSIICNKTDLKPNFVLPDLLKEYPCINISAKEQLGMDTLREHLKECAGFNSSTEGVFSARRRHITALEKALAHIQQGLELIASGNDLELSAEEMREAQQCLNEILGRFTADDLLSEIFNTFCIGK